MGVNSKAILIGHITAPEIINALKEAFPHVQNYEVRSKGDWYQLTFKEPRQVGNRRLAVWPPESELSDYLDIYNGERTIVDLRSWGSDREIIESLAKQFGGYVSIADSEEWTAFEASSETMDALPPEDRLKINLAKILPLRQANILMELVDRQEDFDAVLAHMTEYAAKRERALSGPTL